MISDLVERLASLPSPLEVWAFRPSAQLAERTEVLLAKNRDIGFSKEEQAEWDEIMQMEHLVRLAKAKAAAQQAG